MRKLNVAIIGHNFMGKAHDHAWREVVTRDDADLARSMVGETKSNSANAARFITERPLPGAGPTTFSACSGGAQVPVGAV